MNSLAASANKALAPAASKSLALVKNLPATKNEMPLFVKNLFLGQIVFYGAYQIMAGPNQMKMKRYFTVTPSSGAQSLATFHLCHTSLVPLVVNLTALSTLGIFHCKTFGLFPFIRLFGLGCAAASVAVAIDARTNPKQV